MPYEQKINIGDPMKYLASKEDIFEILGNKWLRTSCVREYHMVIYQSIK